MKSRTYVLEVSNLRGQGIGQAGGGVLAAGEQDKGSGVHRRNGRALWH